MSAAINSTPPYICRGGGVVTDFAVFSADSSLKAFRGFDGKGGVQSPGWHVYAEVGTVECGMRFGFVSGHAVMDDFGNLVMTGPLQ